MNYSEEYTEKVQSTYRYFCYHAHNDGRDPDHLMWEPSKFHQFLCDTVQEFVQKPTDKAYEILIINTPPQHGKSTTVTETFPAWYLMRNPDKSVIQVSYSDTLARKFGKRNLDKIKKYGNIFGVELDPDNRAALKFGIKDHAGGMISAGYGAGITGNPAHVLIIDDPVKNRQEADSDADREKKWTDYVDTIESRIQAGGKLILIMTRWHEDDLAGRLMEHYADRCTVVNLPCEAEENDILGRKPGDALCPEIGKDNKWLADFKATHKTEHGIRSWNALYQGRPVAVEGNMIQRKWWRWYDSQELWKDIREGRKKIDKMIMSVDASFKDADDNDYVAIEVWAKIGTDFYLIWLKREHLNFLATIKAIRKTKLDYPMISDILIEDKANGSATIQVLRSQIMGIIAVQPEKSKESRVNAISFAIESGHVHIPKDQDFVWDFVEECAAFPNGKHDDMVDAMSQALIRLIFRKNFRHAIRDMERSMFHRAKKPSRGIGKGDRINVI